MESSGDSFLVQAEPEVQQKSLETPAPDAQAPVPDYQTPVPDVQDPVAESQSPVTDAQAPVADAQAPVTDVHASVPDAQALVGDGQAPVADAQAYVTDVPAPAVDQVTPQNVVKSASNQSSNGGLGDTVAKHYNQLEESGLEARVQSRIFYMRNLNNWIKSVVISEFLGEIRKQNGSSYKINALDLGSGKGGDLLKWKKGHISQLVCADIAATSVDQCESRYKDMVDRNSRDRYQQTMFTSEFITADCTKTRLKELYKDPNYAIDLTSCQFAYHYSFESFDQADRMLQNACEVIKPGGYFIGTTPNAYELVKRWRAAEGNTFGNEVYRAEFDSDNKEDIPLFGAKYKFHLEGVVDCPEFLVHFPTFVELAKKHGMKLVYKKTFAEYVAENSKKGDSRSLLGKMQGLEPYPADEDTALSCKEADGYAAAVEVYNKLYEEARERGDHEGRLRRLKVGTLSQDEWDACTLYVVFAFQKEGGPSQESTEQPASSGRKRTRWGSESATQDAEDTETASPSKKRVHEDPEVTAQATADQETAGDIADQGEADVLATAYQGDAEVMAEKNSEVE